MILLKGHVPVAEPGVMGFLEFPVPTRVSQFDIQRPRAVRFAGGSTMPVASGARVPTPRHKTAHCRCDRFPKLSLGAWVGSAHST